MARKPRFQLPGVPQHIIQRGNNRDPCFYAETDYQRYKHDLLEAARKNHVAIHAYVLMTNHVHLLATPTTPHGISHMMQDVGRRYVSYINRTYRRSGTLWEGRFKASLVDSERYLFVCMRYIELNPVRANMVEHPGEYAWSSYHCNAWGKPDKLIKEHPLYIDTGSCADSRQYNYRELFIAHMDASIIHDVREALNRELVLGREDFKERIEAITKRQTRPAAMGRPRVGEEGGVYYVL